MEIGAIVSLVIFGFALISSGVIAHIAVKHHDLNCNN